MYPNAEQLNDKEKFVWLMSAEKKTIMFSLVSELLPSLSEKRTDKLKNV